MAEKFNVKGASSLWEADAADDESVRALDMLWLWLSDIVLVVDAAVVVMHDGALLFLFAHAPDADDDRVWLVLSDALDGHEAVLEAKEKELARVALFSFREDEPDADVDGDPDELNEEEELLLGKFGPWFDVARSCNDCEPRPEDWAAEVLEDDPLLNLRFELMIDPIAVAESRKCPCGLRDISSFEASFVNLLTRELFSHSGFWWLTTSSRTSFNWSTVIDDTSRLRSGWEVAIFAVDIAGNNNNIPLGMEPRERENVREREKERGGDWDGRQRKGEIEEGGREKRDTE